MYLKLLQSLSVEPEPDTSDTEAVSEVPLSKEVEGGMLLKSFLRAGG